MPEMHMPELRVRVVTTEQLREGYTIRWGDGSRQQAQWSVIKELSPGKWLAKEPESVGDHFIMRQGG